MTTLIILGTIVVTILVIILLSIIITHNHRKSEFKDWKVGDQLILKSTSSEYREIEKLGQTLCKVVGWNTNNLYLSIGDSVHKRSWDCFESNKSAIWRRNYDECKTAMGVDPGFSSEIGESVKSSDKKIHGKPIELLSEVECSVFLKMAIEEEDYDSAELLRKRMESFR